LLCLLVQLLLAGSTMHRTTATVKAIPARLTTAAKLIAPVILTVVMLAVIGGGCGEGTTSRDGAVGSPEPGVTATNLSDLPAEIVMPTLGMNSRLSPDDQELLAQARARGETNVVLLVAAEPGQTGKVAAAIESLGGVIRSLHEDLGYVSATVPVDKVEAVAQLEGVQAVNLDREIPLPDPRPDS
jgi:hypothetical protein